MSLFYSDYKTVTKLIREGVVSGDPINVNVRDEYYNTPLHLQSNNETIKALIEAGADVNAKNNMGNTPLYDQRNPDIIKTLIKYGAEINIQNQYGNTPLHYQETNKSRTKILILAGANVYARNRQTYTPLDSIFEDPRIVYDEILNAQKVLRNFVKRNFKYFVFKRWITDKETVEWLYHPKRGGKYIQRRLLNNLHELKRHKCNS